MPGGGEAGARRTGSRARWLEASLSPQTGFEGALFAQSRLLPKGPNSETASKNQVRLPCLMTLSMSDGGETQFAGPRRWSWRILGAGEEFMLISVTERLVFTLPDLHVDGLLPKAQLCKGQRTAEDSFVFLIISLVIKLGESRNVHRIKSEGLNLRGPEGLLLGAVAHAGLGLERSWGGGWARALSSSWEDMEAQRSSDFLRSPSQPFVAEGLGPC